ncbi:MAG: hypothetical protein HY785_17255 [Oscillatoriophycideae cyanobacterium NC_groundwater_1537_Pr4_S-0.65um_50_18]|nr:hypothetical protein [Oscillatoriophycideae cyanobacterium NC_groundwater_1537_Pr4_S-0.65um_50_18]
MLRRSHFPKPYFWIMLWVILALLLLMAEAILFPQTVMTIVHHLWQTPTPFILQTIV